MCNLVFLIQGQIHFFGWSLPFFEYCRKGGCDFPFSKVVVKSDRCCPRCCLALSDRQMTPRCRLIALTWFRSETRSPCSAAAVSPSRSAPCRLTEGVLCCLLEADDKKVLRLPRWQTVWNNDTGADVLLASHWSHLQSDWFSCVMPTCPAEVRRMRRGDSALSLTSILTLCAQEPGDNKIPHLDVLLRGLRKFSRPTPEVRKWQSYDESEEQWSGSRLQGKEVMRVKNIWNAVKPLTTPFWFHVFITSTKLLVHAHVLLIV